jgi:hypothetical protein
MENKTLQAGHFKEHYGRFPYIAHRMFPAIYMQIPILFSYDHEPGELPGITIRVNRDFENGPEALNAESIHEKLKGIVRKVKQDMEKKYNREPELCLVLGPSSCIYLDSGKENTSTTPPFGGTICSTDGKPMILGVEKHWRDEDAETIIYTRA